MNTFGKILSPSFSIGYTNRGPSNTIASPGMSGILGGGTITERPSSARPTQGEIGHVQAQRNDNNRYSNTFKSNAFDHAQYEPLVRPQTSAATFTQQTQGISIEDYDRQQPGANLYPQQPRKAEDQEIVTKSIKNVPQKVIKEHVQSSNCPCCYNRNILDQNYNSKKNQREQKIAEEREHIQRMQAIEERSRRERHQKKDQDQREMAENLRKIDEEKHNAFRRKAEEKQNREESLKLQAEQNAMRQEQVQKTREQQQYYNSQLGEQYQSSAEKSHHDKYRERDDFNQAPGLEFECYTRDQVIAQERRQTTDFVKQQQAKDRQKRDNEFKERRDVPAGFLNPEQQAQLREHAQHEFADKKNFTAQQMRMNFDEFYIHKQQQDNEKKNQIDRERAHLANVQAQLERERAQQLQEKEARKMEMSQTLNHIDQQKKEAWNKHYKDDSNQRKTHELVEMQQRLKNEAKQFTSQNRDQYKNQLEDQLHQRQNLTQAEKEHEIQREKMETGFEFECYTRDQVMAKEKRNTTQFLKKEQIPLESHKRHEEVAHIRAPPPNLITYDQIESLKEEANYQSQSQKSYLKDQMQLQYYGSIAEKQQKRMKEKREAEESMNKAVA